ncbi:hypothetical protein [Methylorubrum populi]|uniref:Uncharacterized protein n=1 Tax=Methylorubrum populi TaxID=223967 RepID=A0A833MZ97_9HYPH|nr:hypothetical protein [Methylorubrum populi]KAB7782430.1 hypothetical protein F8B43_5185 [Methylorubrum populi]
MEATEDTEFQVETLRGDVRDKILDNIVRRLPCWTQLGEREQKSIIDQATAISSFVIREVVNVVVHRGFTHMLVTTGEWKVKDGIKLQVGASGSVEDITKLAEHGGGSAILVFADARDFFGQRADAAFDKDEPELPIDGEQPAHDPDTGEILDQGEGEEGDEGGNPLPEGEPLPEPPEGEEEGEVDQDDGGEAEEAEAAPSRRRGRSRQTVEA